MLTNLNERQPKLEQDSRTHGLWVGYLKRKEKKKEKVTFISLKYIKSL